MRYRKLDSVGDYTFGRGAANFFVNTPEAVGQAVSTRLKLITGEWFLDTSAGTPWNTQILGVGTSGSYDQAIQRTILGTLGVIELVNYSSSLNRGTRELSVSATINTIYGQTTVVAQVPLL